MCHLNYTECIQSRSHFGHWTYRTHCHLCHTRYLFTPQSSWGVLPKGHKLWNNVATLCGERETSHFSKYLHRVGIEPAWQAGGIAKPQAQTIVPRPCLRESTTSITEVGCYNISANIFLVKLCTYFLIHLYKCSHSTGMSEYSIQNIYDNSPTILLCCLRWKKQNAHICFLVCLIEQAKFHLLLNFKAMILRGCVQYFIVPSLSVIHMALPMTSECDLWLSNIHTFR